MNKKLKEIAQLLSGEVQGDGDQVITGIAGLRDAVSGQLSFVVNEKFAVQARDSAASALIVDQSLDAAEFDLSRFALVRVADSAKAWDQVLQLLKPDPLPVTPGIDPMAAVSETATLGQGVTVMAHATVEAGAVIGDRTVIYPGVYVGFQSRVGCDGVIYPNVVLRERVRLGDRVIVHSGTVIGSDGFGFDGSLVKQEQYGTVLIEDDVEIGANVAIDRARFDVTKIGRGTKIDNLVQIAHNVIIGQNSIIVSQAGIAGSARLGDRVILAGQVGVAGHISIGNGVRVAAKGGVTKTCADNLTLYGNPAGDYNAKKREVVCLRKLPEFMKTMRDLAERVNRLETQSKNNQKSG